MADFQNIYNISHPHIEKIEESDLDKVVNKIVTILKKDKFNKKLDSSIINTMIDPLGFSTMGEDEIVIYKDYRLSQKDYSKISDNDEIEDIWKKAAERLSDELNCKLGWSFDGYFYINTSDFLDNCVEVKSKEEITDVITDNFNYDLEELMEKYFSSEDKLEKVSILKDIIRDCVADGDKFLKFKIVDCPKIFEEIKNQITTELDIIE